MHRLTDYEAVVEECISDVADQWDERCKSLIISLESKVESGERGGERGAGGAWSKAMTHRAKRSTQSVDHKC